MGNDDYTRKDDNKIDKLIEMLTKQGVLVEQVHNAMFGHNGNPGMKEEWDQHKGGLRVWKFLAGGSGAIALLLGLIKIYEVIS